MSPAALAQTVSIRRAQLGVALEPSTGALAPGLEHRGHKGLNHRAEASHRHTRRREKLLGQFKSPEHAQRLLAAHDQVAALFRPKRHRLSARSYRHARSDAFALWGDYAAALAADLTPPQQQDRPSAST